VRYSLVGAFKSPEVRAKIPYAGEGVQAGADPGTAYLIAYISRKFGPVFVMRGKMPTFPNTFAGADGNGLATMPAANLQYWSVCTLASAPSGELWDGLFDMQVPLDKDGKYTIVVSRPEDRPKNATPENGVDWIDWGPGARTGACCGCAGRRALHACADDVRGSEVGEQPDRDREAGRRGRRIATFPNLPYYANFGKIMSHFDGALMGAAVARSDMFIVGVDFIWSRLTGSETFNNPTSSLYGSQGTLKLAEAVLTGIGGVCIPIPAPNLEVYGFAGVRGFGTSDSLTLAAPVTGFAQSASLHKEWADPIGGFTANYRFDPKWFVNVEGDLGGWSDSATGQALGAAGYNWTQSIASTLGHRVLYLYDKQDTGGNGSFRLQQWMYGPYASIKYSF
jgi:hypothetical protein